MQMEERLRDARRCVVGTLLGMLLFFVAAGVLCWLCCEAIWKQYRFW